MLFYASIIHSVHLNHLQMAIRAFTLNWSLKVECEWSTTVREDDRVYEAFDGRREETEKKPKVERRVSIMFLTF